MKTYKIYLSDGDSYVTGMNATFEEAKKYFMGQPDIIEDFETGEETVRHVVRVSDGQEFLIEKEAAKKFLGEPLQENEHENLFYTDSGWSFDATFSELWKVEYFDSEGDSVLEVIKDSLEECIIFAALKEKEWEIQNFFKDENLYKLCTEQV